MKILEPARTRGIRALLSAQVIGNVGDGLDFLAIVTIIVYEWHRGPSALGLLTLSSAVPMILGIPFFGAAADLWQPRSIMVAANLARGAGVLGITLSRSLVPLCLFAVLVAAGTGFFNAAEQRFIRSRVSKDLLLQVNSLRLTTQRILTGLAGPALAALLISISGPRATLGFTAGCFALSAAVVASIGPVPAVTDGSGSRGRLTARVAAGFTYIRNARPLGTLVLTVFVAYTFANMFDVMLPLWYRDIGGGPAFVGVAMSTLGAGGLLGAVALGQLGDRFNLMILIGGSCVLIGTLVGGMAVASIGDVQGLRWVWLVLLVAIGAAASAALISYGTLVQRLTPPELMGRVGAVTGSAITAPAMAGPLLSPLIAGVIGIDGLFLLCGVGLTLVGLLVGVQGKRYAGQESVDPSVPEPGEVLT